MLSLRSISLFLLLTLLLIVNFVPAKGHSHSVWRLHPQQRHRHHHYHGYHQPFHASIPSLRMSMPFGRGLYGGLDLFDGAKDLLSLHHSLLQRLDQHHPHHYHVGLPYYEEHDQLFRSLFEADHDNLYGQGEHQSCTRQLPQEMKKTKQPTSTPESTPPSGHQHLRKPQKATQAANEQKEPLAPRQHGNDADDRLRQRSQPPSQPTRPVPTASSKMSEIKPLQKRAPMPIIASKSTTKPPQSSHSGPSASSVESDGSPLEVVERNNWYDLSLSLPGISPSYVRAEIRGGALFITGERHYEDKNPILAEEVGRTGRYGMVRRMWRLPKEEKKKVDVQIVEAQYDQSKYLLKIRLFKARSIEQIKASHAAIPFQPTNLVGLTIYVPIDVVGEKPNRDLVILPSEIVEPADDSEEHTTEKQEDGAVSLNTELTAPEPAIPSQAKKSKSIEETQVSTPSSYSATLNAPTARMKPSSHPLAQVRPPSSTPPARTNSNTAKYQSEPVPLPLTIRSPLRLVPSPPAYVEPSQTPMTAAKVANNRAPANHSSDLISFMTLSLWLKRLLLLALIYVVFLCALAFLQLHHQWCVYGRDRSNGASTELTSTKSVSTLSSSLPSSSLKQADTVVTRDLNECKEEVESVAANKVTEGNSASSTEPCLNVISSISSLASPAFTSPESSSLSPFVDSLVEHDVSLGSIGSELNSSPSSSSSSLSLDPILITSESIQSLTTNSTSPNEDWTIIE